MKLCLYGCGRDTNSPSGICSPCNIDIHVYGHPQHMTREKFATMTANPADGPQEQKEEEGMTAKKCDFCGEGYMAKGNAQKFCSDDCKAKATNMAAPVRHKEKSPRVSKPTPKAKPSAGLATTPPENQTGAKPAEPGNASIYMTVDVGPYPKLHKYLHIIPDLDAQDLLGVLLRPRLEALEGRIEL